MIRILALVILLFGETATAKTLYRGHFGCFKNKIEFSKYATMRLFRHCGHFDYQLTNKEVYACRDGDVRYVLTWDCEKKKAKK